MHLEFFQQTSELTIDHVMMIQDGKYTPLASMSEETQRILYLRLLENEQSRSKIRMLKSFGITEVKDQVRQFAKCNFASLDHIDDLDETGNLNFEFIKCPYRNHGCKFNSEICIRKY